MLLGGASQLPIDGAIGTPLSGAVKTRLAGAAAANIHTIIPPWDREWLR